MAKKRSDNELHSFAIPSAQWKWLQQQAIERDQSASAVLRQVLAEAMKKKKG